MKKVLIVTFYYPPRQSIASVRLGGLAKYLPRYGWEPIILMPKIPEKNESGHNVIETEYPGDVFTAMGRFFGINSKNGVQEQAGMPISLQEGQGKAGNFMRNMLKSFFAYPDKYKTWIPFAVDEGLKQSEHHSIAAVISSSSPVSTHIIARKIKEKTNIPWIADLRDLWTQSHLYSFNFIRKKIDVHTERSTLGRADALVSVSEPFRYLLQKHIKTSPVYTIQNGFDPDIRGKSALRKDFTVSYTGKLYGGKLDPSPLLKVLAALIEDGRIDPRRIKVRFFGARQKWLEKKTEKFGLRGIVVQKGIIPRQEVICRQRESHLLLLINWPGRAGQGVYSGKIFEYLAAGRPVLALGGERNVVTELLEETGAGAHLQTEDEIKRYLLKLYGEYIEDGMVGYNGIEKELDRYSHVEMARKFSAVLDEVSRNRDR